MVTMIVLEMQHVLIQKDHMSVFVLMVILVTVKYVRVCREKSQVMPGKFYSNK